MGTRKGRVANGPSVMLDDGNGQDLGTVGEWLRRNGTDPEKAGALLLASIRRAGARVRMSTPDRDDVIAEAAARILSDDHAALRRASPSTPMEAWVRGCVRNVSLEAFRARRKEKKKEKVQIEEGPSHTPSPFEVAAERDEANHEKMKVLDVAHTMPRPYGHVLVWKLIEDLSWQQVQARLNIYRPPRCRPIRDRRTKKIIEDSLGIAHDCIVGVDPRAAHPHMYLVKKNPWMCALLPPLKSLIFWRARVVRAPGRRTQGRAHRG